MSGSAMSEMSRMRCRPLPGALPAQIADPPVAAMAAITSLPSRTALVRRSRNPHNWCVSA